ncbi:MAG: ABC transporter substrate-binding protein [Pseudomonadota bacterium]|nr:ABC transporter substrate-binding protein [Pseudomonadota bacterium]
MRPRLLFKKSLTFPAISLVLLLTSGSSQAGPAGEVVGRFHNDLIAVMKIAATTSIEERFKLLDVSVQRTFNMPVMIRIAAASIWHEAGDAEKIAAIRAFTRMSVSMYASRFDGYSGQHFETISERPGPKNTVAVRTQLHRPGDEPVNLTYVLKRYAGTWKAIDVIVAGGISELALRYSEYRAILKRSGLPALARQLHRKSDQILSRVD